MSKGRLEAFSDGVLAIIITIMVLELHVPHEGGVTALIPLIPLFLSYALSFVLIGVYWNNHHHLFQAVKHVDGWVLWANLHLLFWLSLMPFATAWVGEYPFVAWPAAFYGLIQLCSAGAYFLLTLSLLKLHGRDSLLATALGRDVKGKISLVICLIGVLIAFVSPDVSYGMYGLIACIWFVPDSRIEKVLAPKSAV